MRGGEGRQRLMAADKHFTRLIISIGAIVAASAITVAALIGWLAIADPFGGAPHPTDAAMLEQFARVRPRLESHRSHARRTITGIERLAPDFTRPDPAPIVAARLADYRARLHEAGIAHGPVAQRRHRGRSSSRRRAWPSAAAVRALSIPQNSDPDATVVDGDLDAAVDALAGKDALLQRRISERLVAAARPALKRGELTLGAPRQDAVFILSNEGRGQRPHPRAMADQSAHRRGARPSARKGT